MITISQTTVGVSLLLDIKEADTRTMNKRLSRTATLDGGVVIVDSGFSHGDRTFKITAKNVTQEIATSLESLHQDNTIVIISTLSGVFKAALRNLSIKDGGATITALIKEKIS